MANAVQSQNPHACNITQELLRASFDYDPLSGIFTWLERADRSTSWNSRYSGTTAGSLVDGDRISIALSVDGKKLKFLAHRLAFFYMTGQWPVGIDHKDGNPSNNRWENLREATVSQNMRNRIVQSNNKTGLKGVDWKTDKNMWRATIHVDGRQKHLGFFNTAEEAHAAYHAASVKHYGEFACAGTR